MKNRQFAVVLTLICVLSSPVLGAGFSIFEQGAAATGMAGAFSARADDPSAVFYNPAGITQLEGTQISVGATVILPEASVTDPEGKKWDADKQTFLPPNLYLTHHLTDRFNLGFGYGVYYGLGMKWDNNEDFYYRYVVNEVSLTSHYLNPVVAMKLNENFSIAAGLLYVNSTVELAKDIDLFKLSYKLSQDLHTQIQLDNVQMALDGDNGSGDMGFNVAVQSRFDDWRFGVVYRSEVECQYDGNADFTVFSSPYGPQIDAIVASIFGDTEGATAITLPASASMGIGYMFSDRLSMEFDLNWMGWSSYDSLDVDFNSQTLPDTVSVKDWDDVFSYRLGARFNLTDDVQLYGGYLYDENPVPDHTLDAILPDSDRQSIQIGAGYSIGNLKIDGSYMILLFKDRDTSTYEYNENPYLNLNGDYENSAHLIGFQLTYRI